MRRISKAVADEDERRDPDFVEGLGMILAGVRAQYLLPLAATFCHCLEGPPQYGTTLRAHNTSARSGNWSADGAIIGHAGIVRLFAHHARDGLILVVDGGFKFHANSAIRSNG